MGEIDAAINLIDVKKENLRKSFLHLQSQSHSSYNLPLKWEDFDSYFTTLRSSLQCEFHHLQTLYPYPDTTSALARPDLKSFCQNSDGLGLRRFISLTYDPQSLLAQLPDAYRCAPDAAAMVLDAIEGFYSGDAKGKELRFLKRACVIMLEGLMRVKPDVRVELMEKAMMVAVEWNQKRKEVEWNQKWKAAPLKEREENALGFLLLVGAYGLIDGFSIDDLITCIVMAAEKRDNVDLCRQMIPANKINDVMEKLINKGLEVVAVKYSIEFEKTEEFPPVGLLEERILQFMRSVDDCNMVVTKKEVKSLKLIMNCIDEYQLESVYSKGTLLALVNKLNNRLPNKQPPPKKQKLVQPPPAAAAVQLVTNNNN